jgi:hypothetical protein
VQLIEMEEFLAFAGARRIVLDTRYPNARALPYESHQEHSCFRLVPGRASWIPRAPPARPQDLRDFRRVLALRGGFPWRHPMK